MMHETPPTVAVKAGVNAVQLWPADDTIEVLVSFHVEDVDQTKHVQAVTAQHTHTHK